jgi:hypothetical protein
MGTKKETSDDLLSGYYSSSLTFHTKKAVWVVSFLEHLMLRLSTKSDKPYTIMMA